MNNELKEAIEILEKEKGISKATLLDSIEQSLMQACKANFGKNDNINVTIDPETCDYRVTAEKEVVEDEEHHRGSTLQVTLEEAQKTDPHVMAGDIITVDINSKAFGRIATQNAKNVILQRIREEERNVVYNQYSNRLKTVVSGVVQRQQGKTYLINLGKADAMLNENEQVKGEKFQTGDRVKVYVVDVKNSTKGPEDPGLPHASGAGPEAV